MTRSPISEMLFGALVADAAALGVHWLYDPDRIAKIAGSHGDSTAFLPVDAAHYEGAKGIFVHHGRSAGMLSQYGEGLRLAIRSITAHGGFDVSAFKSEFAAFFGPGGNYVGYIDRPTRAALDNIATENNPTGIDDDQLPATVRLPAIMAAYHGRSGRVAAIKSAMEVTNVNAVAQAYTNVFADLMAGLLDWEAFDEVLKEVVALADPTIRGELEDALNTDIECSVAYGEKTGRACHLPMGGPLIFHILARSDDFREAVERNNKAGGDSAGRAILIGAVMGCSHGVGTDTGVPMDWALRLQDGVAIWDECNALKD